MTESSKIKIRQLYDRLRTIMTGKDRRPLYIYLALLTLSMLVVGDGLGARGFSGFLFLFIPANLLLLLFYGLWRYYKWIMKVTGIEKKHVDTMRRDTMNAIAHEVRTPLASILGYTEMLRIGACEDRQDYYLEQIEEKGHEISHMIDDILRLARLEDSQYQMQKEVLSVNEIMHELARDLPVIWNEEGEWIIDADREYMQRMLKCLLDNAMQYRTDDTPVTIGITRRSLTMHNQCEPLDEEMLRHIFEFRTKEDGHYSFGLFFCHKAAEKNGLTLQLFNDTDGVTAVLCA